MSTFFGSQEVMVDVKKNMVTNPVAINVKALANLLVTAMPTLGRSR